MDASQRWETEALRSGSLSHKSPPRPSTEQRARETGPHDTDGNWVTLREAESATGIPLNTLRKWSRKSVISSYLESDGDLSLRMVDLDAVITHAHDLGRDVAPIREDEDVEETVEVEPSSDDEPEDTADDIVDEIDAETESESENREAPAPPDGTLIVPLDAWNKVLNQLGNLHEAGQQLAEARERAAKAETEATFLRERLAELRADGTEPRAPSTASSQDEDGSRSTVDSFQSEKDAQGDEIAESSTSYWRYLTFGWRDRKRASRKT